jgi:hypothetical protein
VAKWRGRFSLWGLRGLRDQLRPGKPVRYDTAFRNGVLALLEQPPPLGMSHSTFEDPLPVPLAPLMARAYRTLDPPGSVDEHYPVHLLVASAADIGRFMQVLLDGGQLNGSKILQPGTLAQMLAPQVTTPVGDVGLAFYEYLVGDVRFIGKDGNNYFHSILMLKPEQAFGIFVAYNGQTLGGRPLDELLTALADRYFSPSLTTTSIKPSRASTHDASAYAGVYQDTRRSEGSLFKVDALLRQIVIKAVPDGGISVRSAAVLWAPSGVGREIEPSVYALPRGVFLPQGLRIALETTRSGRQLALAAAGVLAFERVPWHESATLIVPPMFISTMLVGLTLFLWPFASIIRQLRHRSIARNQMDKIRFVLVRAVLGVDLMVLGGLIAFLNVGPDHVTDASDPWLVTLYTCAWIGVFGALLTIWAAIRFWRDKVGGLWLRIHHTGLAAAAFTMAWFFAHWHVAGTTLQF